MNWKTVIEDFHQYLKLEKGLSDNSINAYLTDIQKLQVYLQLVGRNTEPEMVSLNDLKGFLGYLTDIKISARTQSRIISGIKSFFRFLMLEEKIEKDPTASLDTPKLGRKLPVVLSIEEVNDIINAIDITKSEGRRNKAIIETLYSCGLRVSELVDLKISNLFFESGYIKVEGKGSKERLVPISPRAIKEINLYLSEYRRTLNVTKEGDDILFLNRRGAPLSRVMIFTIIKDVVDACGIKKEVSPHTFRHSFATHLIQGGASIRAVQEMLGHESIMTTEIYTHLDNNYLMTTVEKFHPRAGKDGDE